MMQVTLQGAKEIERLFRQLERKESAKAARKATRETQKETVLKDAKTNATSMVGGEMGGKLSRSLAVRKMDKLMRGDYGAKTIIKESDFFVHIAEDGTRHYIPNAIEYGHGFPGNAGNKDVSPIPFMRKAFEDNRTRAYLKMAPKIMKLLNEAVRRNKVG